MKITQLVIGSTLVAAAVACGGSDKGADAPSSATPAEVPPTSSTMTNDAGSATASSADTTPETTTSAGKIPDSKKATTPKGMTDSTKSTKP